MGKEMTLERFMHASTRTSTDCSLTGSQGGGGLVHCRLEIGASEEYRFL